MTVFVFSINSIASILSSQTCTQTFLEFKFQISKVEHEPELNIKYISSLQIEYNTFCLLIFVFLSNKLTEKKFESNLIAVLVVLIAQLYCHVKRITTTYHKRRIVLVEDVVLVGSMLLGIVTLKQFHSDYIVW